MNDAVFDSSVILALLLEESPNLFAGREELLEGVVLSTVSIAEIRSKLIELRDLESDAITELLRPFKRVEPFTESQAVLAGELRRSTRHLGLSFGDRACLALALELGLDVYTVDRVWARVDVGCTVHVLR